MRNVEARADSPNIKELGWQHSQGMPKTSSRPCEGCSRTCLSPCSYPARFKSFHNPELFCFRFFWGSSGFLPALSYLHQFLHLTRERKFCNPLGVLFNIFFYFSQFLSVLSDCGNHKRTGGSNVCGCHPEAQIERLFLWCLMLAGKKIGFISPLCTHFPLHFPSPFLGWKRKLYKRLEKNSWVTKLVSGDSAITESFCQPDYVDVDGDGVSVECNERALSRGVSHCSENLWIFVPHFRQDEKDPWNTGKSGFCKVQVSRDSIGARRNACVNSRGALMIWLDGWRHQMPMRATLHDARVFGLFQSLDFSRFETTFSCLNWHSSHV